MHALGLTKSAGLFSTNDQVRDSDLTFLVHSYQDSEQLDPMLIELRGIYPEARLIVCSDGDPDPELPVIAAKSEAEFHLGENLYSYEHGGAVCHRMLNLFLSKPTPYFFKVDPDTKFHRRFAYLPAHSGMFGTLQCSEWLCSIQGGCFGLTLDWATWLHRNQVMLDPSLNHYEKTWAVHPWLLNHCRKLGRVSSDWLFGYVATTVGIPQFGFGEVMSHWRKPVVNDGLKYAVTHPVERV